MYRAGRRRCLDHSVTLLTRRRRGPGRLRHLIIGAPFDNVDNVSAAGSVSVLFGAPGGISASGSQFRHQGAGSSTSLRESDDRYGRSLAAYPRTVATPFEPDHVSLVPLALRSKP